MTQGRPKGAKAELEVAAILAEWWGGFEPGTIFKRTPGSGGWASKDAREAFGTAGDLVTTSDRFPFSVEIKRREGWAWDPLISGKKSPVWKWWRQAVTQGEEMHKVPMLWLRHNREPWAVMLPLRLLQARVEVFGSLSFNTVLDLVGGARRIWYPSELKRVDYTLVLPALLSAAAFMRVTPANWCHACGKHPAATA